MILIILIFNLNVVCCRTYSESLAQSITCSCSFFNNSLLFTRLPALNNLLPISLESSPSVSPSDIPLLEKFDCLSYFCYLCLCFFFYLFPFFLCYFSFFLLSLGHCSLLTCCQFWRHSLGQALIDP